MKKTKAAIKWTLTFTASTNPEVYKTMVEAVQTATELLSEVGDVAVTGPTIVRVEV